MKKSKLFLILFALLAFGQMAWAQTPTFSGGSGTEDSPYKINSQSDLNELAQYVNGTGDYSTPHSCNGLYFEMTSDIDVTVAGTSNNYTPIGNRPIALIVFDGHFDGKGYTISGINCTQGTSSNDKGFGLFGGTGSNAVISNIILSNSTFFGFNEVGGIVGENWGTITNCVVTSSVTIKGHGHDSEYRGGIVGYHNSGTVSHCYSAVQIESYSESMGGGTPDNTLKYEYMGGIAGKSEYGAIMNNNIVSGAKIPATKVHIDNDDDYGYSCGAIAGGPSQYLTYNYYTNCTVAGISNATNVGVGNYRQNPNSSAPMTQDLTTNDGAVYGHTFTLGENITSNATQAGIATYVYNAAKTGDDVTLTYTGTVSEGYYAKFTVLNGDTPVDVYHHANNTQAHFTMPDANVTVSASVEVIPWSGGGNSENNPYIIEYASQWNLLAANVNSGTDYYANKFFRLDADIDVSTMVGGGDGSSNVFKGTFDGNNHTITFNMGTSDTPFSTQYCAPFRRINSATIQNLKVAGTVTSSHKFAGGVVAYAYGSNNAITNCINSTIINATISNGSHGGILGQLGGSSNSVTISGCSFNGKMLGTNTDYWCGIIGYYGSNSVTINNCFFNPEEINVRATDNNYTICRPGPTVNNCYYNTEAEEMHEKQGKQARYISAGTDVTVAFSGDATEHNVSGITTYAGTPGMRYNNGSTTNFIAGDGDEVKLNLTYNGEVPAHFELQFIPTNIIIGNGNPFTLDMPDDNVEIGYQIVPVDWATENTGDDADHAYMIYTKEQLDLLAYRVNIGYDYPNKYFKLGDNIQYDYETVNNYTPIGDGTYVFNGNFDGNGHTISNIHIESTETNQGLFGNVGSSANISNLLLYNTNISGSTNTGLIAGYAAQGATVNAYWRNCTLNNVSQNNVYVINSGSEFVTSPTQANISYNNVDYYANGTTITLTSTAPSSFDLNNYTVTPTVGDPFDVEEETGVYSFNMPASDIAITANYQNRYWDGYGTANDPFIISNTTEWGYLVTNVAAGENYSGVYFKLGANITVTTMVGTSEHAFSGNFDGNRSNNYKVTFNHTATGNYVGLFRYVDGANIHDLHVAGTVHCTNNDYQYCATVVAHTSGTTYLTNCLSTATIDGYQNTSHSYYYLYSSGFVGQNASGALTITNCIFNGEMDLDESRYCAGFVGKNTSGATLTIENSFYNPTLCEVWAQGRTFVHYENANDVSINNCYYNAETTDKDFLTVESQGTAAYTTSGDALSHQVVVAGETIYTRFTATITGVNDIYTYTGSNINITPGVTYGTETLTVNEDYVISLYYESDPADYVNSRGAYVYVVEGIGEYVGTITKDFVVSDITGTGTSDDPYIISSTDDWNDLAYLVSNGYTYDGEYFQLADDITISKMVGTSKANCFQGSFDGAGYTLTLSGDEFGSSGSYFSEVYCAPFRYVAGTTIRNLVVAGDIYTSNQKAGGIIAFAGDGDILIDDCLVSVNIHSSKNGDGTHGGFISHLQGDNRNYRTATFNNCAFTGSITTTNGTTNVGGFVGWCEWRPFATEYGYWYLVINNCLVAPNADGINNEDSRTFARCRDIDNSLTINNSYYAKAIGGTQGEEVINDPAITHAGAAINTYPYSGLTFYINGVQQGSTFYHYTDIMALEVTAANNWDNPNETIDGWHFIASPVADNTDPDDVVNLVAETAADYDLYELVNTTWANYKVHDGNIDPGFKLVNGQGYLYATKETKTLIFTGPFNTGDSKEVNLSEGYNLVGNPFTVAAYVNKPYYTLNADGSAVLTNSPNTGAISPCYGVIVEGENDSDKVTFSTTQPDESSHPNNGGLNVTLTQANTRGNAMLDKAIVSFNEGAELGKFYFGRQNANIYIPQGNEEYAIAFSEGQGEVPVNFKAKENGTYTISVNPEGVEMAYLHLIDNMTGADVDLLTAGPSTGSGASYSFTAKTTDYESRFKLVFSANGEDGPSTGSGAFAYVNNEEIIITDVVGDACNASLQVIDVTGRIVRVCTDVARNVSTAGMMPGVYVLRLIDGNDVKVQKIVIE